MQVHAENNTSKRAIARERISTQAQQAVDLIDRKSKGLEPGGASTQEILDAICEAGLTDRQRSTQWEYVKRHIAQVVMTEGDNVADPDSHLFLAIHRGRQTYYTSEPTADEVTFWNRTSVKGLSRRLERIQGKQQWIETRKHPGHIANSVSETLCAQAQGQLEGFSTAVEIAIERVEAKEAASR